MISSFQMEATPLRRNQRFQVVLDFGQRAEVRVPGIHTALQFRFGRCELDGREGSGLHKALVDGELLARPSLRYLRVTVTACRAATRSQ